MYKIIIGKYIFPKDFSSFEDAKNFLNAIEQEENIENTSSNIRAFIIQVLE